MNANTESWLKNLEDESKALKQSFERTATSIPMITKTLAHNTTRNAVTQYYDGGSNTLNDPERVIVTYNTNTGANTIAKLEIQTDSPRLPYVRRIPYSGGARWVVAAGTKNDITWQSTNYVFTVQSLVDGTLSATEATA